MAPRPHKLDQIDTDQSAHGQSSASSVPQLGGKTPTQPRGVRIEERLRPETEPWRVPPPLSAVRTGSGYVVDSGKPLSQSLLWELQKRYYNARGVDAWTSGEVPHYATSNPTIAASYAELVFACMRDNARRASSEPQVVIELGAGPGRFAFHFLRHLSALCATAEWDLASTPFVYVMTDFAEGNLSYWQAHPQLAPFFEAGILDVALFDVASSERLELRRSHETMRPGSLANPPCIIANYVFDVAVQELFYFSEQQFHECRVKFIMDDDPGVADIATVLNGLRCEGEIGPATDPAYDVAEYNAILSDYRQLDLGGYAFFPIGTLECLRRLRALSPRGAVVLIADMGGRQTKSFVEFPPLVHHGSISFSLDFHAIARYCAATGGLALFPMQSQENIQVAALLLVDEPQTYKAALGAFEEHIGNFGPDDFLRIFTHVTRALSGMTLRDVAAYLRLCRYDCDLLTQCLMHLWTLMPEFTREDRLLFREIVERCWDNYFSLSNRRDLAFDVGLFLYDIDFDEDALRFFRRSLELCGVHSGTLYNASLCCREMGDAQQEVFLLHGVLEIDALNVPARERLAQLESLSAIRS